MKDIIKHLRSLEAAATPGPWNITTSFTETDDRLMEEMRNSIKPLLDRLEKLEAVVEAAEDVAPFLEEGHTLVVALAALDADNEETQT
jgi:hypothetical protein